MKLSDTRINSARLEAGDWVDNIPDFGDLRLKVRGIGNADYDRLRAELLRALPRAKRNDTAAIAAFMPQLLVETVLIDWQNVDEGAYSKDLALKFLSDPDYRPLIDAVVWAAEQVANAKVEELGTDAKN